MKTRPKHSTAQNGMRLPAIAHSFLAPFSHPPAPRSGQQQDAIWVVDAAQFDFVKGMGDSVTSLSTTESTRFFFRPWMFYGF